MKIVVQDEYDHEVFGLKLNFWLLFYYLDELKKIGNLEKTIII